MSGNGLDETGRSRGRGRGALLKHPPDPKPGVVKQSLSNGDGDGDADVDSTVLALRSLPLAISEPELARLVDAVKTYATTADRLRVVANTLQRRCDDNWHFAESAARLASRLAPLMVDNVTFRSHIISCVHKDYCDIDRLRGDDPACFLGVVALMSQLFAHLLLHDGAPIALLFKPIMCLMEKVFDSEANDDEIICGATQLLATGRLLHESLQESNLLQTIRDKIIDGRGSPQARLVMIHVLEAAASNRVLADS